MCLYVSIYIDVETALFILIYFVRSCFVLRLRAFFNLFLSSTLFALVFSLNYLLLLLMNSTQNLAHSTQKLAHSTQKLAHSTQKPSLQLTGSLEI
jgi:hypothetical protein